MPGRQAEAGTSLNINQTTTAHPDRTSGRRGPVFGVMGAVLLVGYVADQVTKVLAVRHLVQGEDVPVLGPVLALHLTYNPGAAFSMGTGMTWVLTGIACAVVVYTFWSARRLRSMPWAVALGLLLAGALGNLTDRWFRAPGPGRGHVVDFLRLPNWPIFNVADMCIVTAACLICLLALRGVRLDGTREGQGSPHRGKQDDHG